MEYNHRTEECCAIFHLHSVKTSEMLLKPLGKAIPVLFLSRPSYNNRTKTNYKYIKLFRYHYYFK